MRVLMVDTERTWRGGQAQVELLMRGLVDRGVDVALAAPPESAIASKARARGFEVLPLPSGGDLDVVAAWRLQRYLREGSFDIVHCHSSHAHAVGCLAVGFLRGVLRRGSDRPRLVVSRRVDFPVGGRGIAGLKYRRIVDRFVAVSTGVRRVLVEGGVSEQRIDVVPDGIDLAKFDAVRPSDGLRRELGLALGDPAIGNVGALAPHKSQEDFVRAARIILEDIPRARFFVVGEGDLRPKLERLVAELGLKDALVLTGFRDDVLEILSLFDCFVLSSYLEGLCTSIMDAHALGVPVVATRTGGVPDLVADGETGLLVPPRDPQALARAVVRMLRDEDLRERCVRQGRAQARRYDYGAMVEGTLVSYRRALGVQCEKVD